MASCCEKEFKVKNFGFTHPRPHLFALPQFGPKILYPIWTVFALLYHVSILTADALITIDKFGEPRAQFFLYFTSWSYLLLAIYSLVDCITTLHWHCQAKHIIEQRNGKPHAMPCYLKLNWALFTITGVVGFSVTLVYWVVFALANVIEGDWQEDKIFVDVWEFGSITFHIFNAVMIFLHIIISAKPSRILHVYLPMIFCVLYATFNVVYQIITCDYIYQPLDWDNTAVSVLAVVVWVLVLIPIMHLLVHGLILVRTALGEWCQRRQQNGRVHPQQQNGDDLYETISVLRLS